MPNLGDLELDLNDIVGDEVNPNIKTNKKVSKISKNKSTKKTSDDDKLRNLTKGLPSAKLAKYDLYRQAPRVQMNISNVPDIIRDDYDSRAAKLGLGKKEYFFYLLRLDGIEIPDDKYLDSRKIIR